MLDKASPIPLYHQLAENLRARIVAGELPVGEQIPSELELSKQAGISRMTVRQAIASLVRENVLEVMPGIGTFVAEPKLSYDAARLFGFSEEMARLGRPAHSIILSQGVIHPPEGVLEGLELSAGQMTVRFYRLRYAEDVPLLLETNYVPAALCPGLESEDLVHQSFYTLLREKYRITLLYARQALEAVAANEDESRHLGVEIGAPIMLSRGVTYSDKDQPVEYFKVAYRGDKFKFELQSQRFSLAEAANSTRLNVILGLD